ncbi:hypothetical protein HPB51_018014 [Rhipicephalus microplus]|uniref:Uncharacterized protein n=1 Tax=Rhipicephalus microplus TaxID=6941 RepID=A0A9J6D5N3_RHIMP|nr:hypothetical protein HPB51_018014 [Rhipicephalus microplus]
MILYTHILPHKLRNGAGKNHLWNEGKDRLKNALSPGSSPPRSPSPSYLDEHMGSPPAKTVRLGKGATAFSHDFSEDEEEEEDEDEPERHNDEPRDLAALIRA